VRVFLDVGAHDGETVEEVAKAKYRFDRIVCFEPASSCIAALEKLRESDPRIEIQPFGLSDSDGEARLFNAGTLAGSIVGGDGPAETVKLVDVARWVTENLSPSDFVVAKANCEGAEVRILNRLLDKALLDRVVTFLIMFDVRDFPEHRHEELEIRQRLRASGLNNVCFSDNAMIGRTHSDGIAHWLHLFGVDRPELDRENVRRIYARNFRLYASKSGRRQRLERLMKENFGYYNWPDPIKHVLQWLKLTLRLGQER
jgi:FkbM family methyltransferase